MKFLHLGDLHLGKSLRDFSLIDDQRYILDRILDTVRSENVDAVLIAGDVYDRAVPSEEAVRLLDDFLFRLSEMHTAVLLISGNHDSDERLNFGSRIFSEKNLFFCTKFDGTLKKVTLSDEYGPVDFYLLPFVKASQVRHFYPDETIGSYDEAVRAVIRHADIDPSRRNVILAHQFVTPRRIEARPHEETSAAQKAREAGILLGGSENPAAVSVGLVEQIGADVFDPFDYAALGHIHRAQAVGRECVRYCGTPLKYHQDEAGDGKTMPVVTMEEKGSVQIRLEPLEGMRDMRVLRGPIRKLLAPENITSPEDFIFAALTDEEIIPDAMTIFRQYYPNTLQIRYDNAHTRSLENAEGGSTETRKMSFPELISVFYEEMYGCAITEEEMAIMKKAAKEAGIFDETD